MRGGWQRGRHLAAVAAVLLAAGAAAQVDCGTPDGGDPLADWLVRRSALSL